MAFTNDDLAALDEAIASGELTVKINGREVTYRTIDALLQAKRHINRTLARQAGVKRSPLGGIVTRGSRGL